MRGVASVSLCFQSVCSAGLCKVKQAVVSHAGHTVISPHFSSGPEVCHKLLIGIN